MQSTDAVGIFDRTSFASPTKNSIPWFNGAVVAVEAIVATLFRGFVISLYYQCDDGFLGQKPSYPQEKRCMLRFSAFPFGAAVADAVLETGGGSVSKARSGSGATHRA